MFQSFQRREALGKYLGPLRDFVQLKTAFLRGDVYSCLAMIPLSNAKAILQLSGQNGMAVGSSPEVDKQLDLNVVFCAGSSMASILLLLDAVEHYGVVGPLRRGGWCEPLQALLLWSANVFVPRTTDGSITWT
eukprot:6457906-Amphidinium_carterae.1